MKKQPRKILVIKPSALGDIVMALPAVCSLKQSFPEAQLDFFIRPEFAPLIENHRCIDNIVIFDRRKLGKWWYKPSSFAELWRLVRKLRRAKYDVVIDMQGRFRSAIFAWFSGCSKRIGAAKTQEFTRLFYNKTVMPAETNIHQVDFNFDLARAAGATAEAGGNVQFGLQPDSAAVQQVQEILEEQKVPLGNYGVLVAGAAVDIKRWPVENFAQLADKIYEKYNCGFVAIGSNAEKPLAEKLQVLTAEPVANLAGRTNIKQLVALLAGAKFVVSNDTGPAHIAGALGRPIVLVFGFTNPNRVAPYGRKQTTVCGIELENRKAEVESTNPAYDIKNVLVESVFEKLTAQLG